MTQASGTLQSDIAKTKSDTSILNFAFVSTGFGARPVWVEEGSNWEWSQWSPSLTELIT